MFMQAENASPKPQKIRDATTAMVVVAVILGLSAVFGLQFLKVFGVSLDAFSVAGGLVLLGIGGSILTAKNPGSDTSTGDQVASDAEQGPKTTRLI